MFDRSKESRDNAPKASTVPEEVQDVRKPVISTTTSPSRTTAVIGPTVRIKGDIVSDENLIIEGQVEGTVSLDSHELVVGQSGVANANVTAKLIRVDGRVKGDLIGREKVVISKSGNMTGNISAPTVILEEGGKFKGSIDMGHSSESAVAGFASAGKAARNIEPAPEAPVAKQG